jgi:hypothetical protein
MSDKRFVKHEKILALVVLFLGIECLVLLASSPVGAQVIGGLDQANSAAGLPKLASGDLSTSIGQVVSGVMGLIGSIMFLYLLYGGFRWMVAGGDAKGVSEAQSIIKNAVIGIAIIIFAYTLASFVIDRLASVATAPAATSAASAPTTDCQAGFSCMTPDMNNPKMECPGAAGAGGCSAAQACCKINP